MLPRAGASDVERDAPASDDEHSSALEPPRRSLRHGEGAVSGGSDQTIEIRPERQPDTRFPVRSQRLDSGSEGWLPLVGLAFVARCPSRRARPSVSRLSSAGVDGGTSLSLCQASYDAHAAEYAQRLDPTLAPAVERLVELAGARRGIRLLDLATGTGAVARTAARTGASVVGVDLSPGMLAVARELAPEIDFRLADAHALPFEACE